MRRIVSFSGAVRPYAASPPSSSERPHAKWITSARALVTIARSRGHRSGRHQRRSGASWTSIPSRRAASRKRALGGSTIALWWPRACRCSRIASSCPSPPENPVSASRCRNRSRGAADASVTNAANLFAALGRRQHVVAGGGRADRRQRIGGHAVAQDLQHAREAVLDLRQRVVAAAEPDQVLAVAEHALESGHVVRQVEAAARERQERAV